MTLRTLQVLAALLATWTAGSASAAGSAVASKVAVRLASSYGVTVGRAATLTCEASDPAGIKDVVLEVASPSGAVTGVAIVSQVDLGRGAVQVEGSWVPTKSGDYRANCRAAGMSSATASGAATLVVPVAPAYAPVILSMTVDAPVVLVGATASVKVEALDTERGLLKYAWSATGGTVVGNGAAATWTAPSADGVFAVKVTITDDTGATVSKSIPVEASSTVFRDSAAAKLNGPRRIAASPEGELWVVDAYSRLIKLTRRGEYMGAALEGARSVAVGGGKVFVGMSAGELVVIDPATARVEKRIALGGTEGPAGIAFDAARNQVWLAYSAGLVEARGLDGTVKLRITAVAPGVALVRVVDVAVDSAAGVVWVAQDRAAVGGMIFGFRAADGAKVATIGQDGSGPVRTAGSLAVAPGGQLYVSDLFSGQVKVVSSSGAAVRTIGRRGRGAGELALPAGMSFMANGDVMVANMDANRIDRFGAGAPPAVCAGDADCDGLSDAVEASAGLDPNAAGDALADADGDGLNNTQEIQAGTSVQIADSDGDGFSDGVEVSTGFDPRNGADHVAHLTASAASGGPGLVRLSGTIGGLVGAADCTQSWRQVEGPPVVLEGADGAAPAFVARKAGAYRFAYDAVCDGVRAIGAVAALTIDNVAPVVDAGRVLVAPIGARLQLSAAAPTDANGDAVRLAWEQVAGRPVANATPGRSVTARFVDAGTYAFNLSAVDAGGAASSTETQVVVVGGTPVPAAAVTGPVLAVVNQVVTLDASASFAGPDAVFAWQQVGGPAVALAGQGTAQATFQAPAPGRYAFKVAIQQGAVRSPAALAEVFVAPVGAALPVAAAQAAPVANVNSVVVLDGSASSGSGALAYAWRQVAGPAAGLRGADGARAEAFCFAPGAYVFELSVADAAAVSVPVRVAVEVREAGAPIPVAVVSAAESGIVGERLVLDGSASQGAKSFRWTQVSGPWVALEGGARAAFVAPAAGKYGFELEVDDGQVRSAPVRVDVVVTQNGTEN
jgi:PKD repeat protein